MSQISSKKTLNQAPIYRSTNDTLKETLLALGLDSAEIDVYNYYFLYGPVTALKATQGINYPTYISLEQLKEITEKLQILGFLTKESSSTGLEFLIQQTEKPGMEKLNQELKDWKKNSIR